MKNFVLNLPTRIYFGKGQENALIEILNSYNYHNILLVYGQKSVIESGLLSKIESQLLKNNVKYHKLGGVKPNPSLELALKGIEVAKKENIDLILAIGGGSVIDTAKEIAVGAKVNFNPWLFQTKEEIVKDALPVGVILTIAAAGSETSDSCVIVNEAENKKMGFNTDLVKPKFAVLNPELTYSVNKYQTACGIVDIIMHTLERYFTDQTETNFTDRIAEGLIISVIEAGRKVMKNPEDYDARADLMMAGAFSHNGVTGTNRLMMVHQIESRLCSLKGNSHGAGLACLWPSWAKVSYKIKPEKFDILANNLLPHFITNDHYTGLDLIDFFKDFFIELGLEKSLKEFGVREDEIEKLSSMICPNDYVYLGYYPMGKDQVLSILKDAF